MCIGLLLVSVVVLASEGFINWLKHGFLSPWSTPGPRNAISFLDDWLLFLAYMALLSLVVALTASLLIAYFAPDRNGQRRFWVWWTIGRYALGHYALVAVFPVAVAFFSFARWAKASEIGGPILVMMWLGCTMLMCLTMGAAAQQRTGRRLRGVGAAIMVFAFIEAVLLGVFTAVVRELL